MTDIATLVADNIHIWTGAIQRKSGAGRGGGKRISLYGIERLRALILDLAVSGKLVPQEAGDEPAGDLLKRMKAATSTTRKQSKKQIDLPFELREGWVSLPFGELAEEISTGPFGTMVHREDYITGGVPLINPSHMIEDRIVEDDTISLPISKADSLNTYRLMAGDIVFARRGDVGRLALVTDREHGWLCGTGSFRARFNGHYVQPFLLKFFRSHTARSFLGSASVGATMANLNQGILSELPIPLPPLAEQRRIVAKVDELMALCDALERESADAMAAHQALVEVLLAALVNSTDAADLARRWARLERHFDTLFATDASIDALKHTILDLAVRGKLADPDTPSVVNWVELPLEKLIGPMDSGWSPACHEYPSTSEDVWGVLKTTAVQDMQYDPEQNKELPTKLHPRPEAEARAGDVLITRAGPTNRVGICCFVASTRPRLMISDKIIRFRPISSVVEGEFLALALSVGKAAQQIEKAKSGMAASQVNISQSKLKAIIVPVPPLAEQRRIVTKVGALMACCDALKARLADATRTQRHLADAITERAAA